MKSSELALILIAMVVLVWLAVTVAHNLLVG
jgi:Protein of unknown function (DUF1214)